jgi:hypothetical protein
MKRALSVLISILFAYSPVMAQSSTMMGLSSNEDLYRSRISEYFYSRTGSEILKPVKILGYVNKPGLYHVPDGISLSTLLSISGGGQAEGDLEGIKVLKSSGTTLDYNLMEMMKGGKDIAIADGDTIFVPPRESMFGQPTVNAVVIVTGIFTAILTMQLIANQGNRQ